MKRIWQIAQRVLRLLPLLLMGALALSFLLSGREISLKELLSYTPPDLTQAVLFLWLAFAVKSLSVMLPVLLLFAASGVLFPLPAALLVNTVGIVITLTLPYLVGRLSGPDLTERLRAKYPRLSEMRALRGESGFFFAFIVRAIGILPCDIVSLYMGNTRLSYPAYIAGGVLGFMPDLICATLVGMKSSDTGSPWFWIPIGLNLCICAVSFLLYRAYLRRHRGRESSGGKK